MATKKLSPAQEYLLREMLTGKIVLSSGWYGGYLLRRDGADNPVHAPTVKSLERRGLILWEDRRHSFQLTEHGRTIAEVLNVKDRQLEFGAGTSTA